MMFWKFLLAIVLIFLVNSAAIGQQSDSPSAVVLDESVWVTFYDLPSRRFRAIRSAVLTRDYQSAARDLAVAAAYLSVEAERAPDFLKVPLAEAVDRLRQMEQDIESVTLEDLDSWFGRTHWLLAQHYLAFARVSRDARNSRSTSNYLWATTHHIERAVLWSGVAITRDVHAALEDLRELAAELGNPKTAANAYRERPVVRAEMLLTKIGKQINRRVLLPMPQNDRAESGPAEQVQEPGLSQSPDRADTN